MKNAVIVSVLILSPFFLSPWCFADSGVSVGQISSTSSIVCPSEFGQFSYEQSHIIDTLVFRQRGAFKLVWASGLISRLDFRGVKSLASALRHSEAQPELTFKTKAEVDKFSFAISNQKLTLNLNTKELSFEVVKIMDHSGSYMVEVRNKEGTKYWFLYVAAQKRLVVIGSP